MSDPEHAVAHVQVPALFKLMAEQIPGVVWSTDTELRFTASFGAGLDALQLHPGEVVGRTLFEYFRTADESHPVIAAHRRALRGESVNLAQVWQERDYQVHVERLLDDSGNVIGCIGVARDITARKQAETALRESEERFRKVFEEGPLGIALVDLDSRIRHVNRRLCEMLGYSEAEIIELGIPGISHPDDWQKDRQLGQRLLRGEIPFYTIDKRYVCKDGQALWTQLTVSMTHDAAGRGTHVIGMIEDITDRRHAERALLDSERRLGMLLSNLPGALYRCRADANWTVEFLSDGYAALTGYSAADRRGQPGSRHSELIHPDDRQQELEAMQQAVAEKRPYQAEYRLRTAAGQEKWVWEKGLGIFSENGELEAIEGFTTDITARKEAELALQRAREELEVRVAERTAELRQNHDQLQAIWDGVGDGLLVADIETQRFYQANPAICQMFGYSEQELLALTVSDIHPPQALARVRESFRAQAEGRLPGIVQLPCLRKDGTVFFADVSVGHVVYQGRPCLVGFFRDITERQRAQDALEREQRALRLMLLASDHERRLMHFDIHDGVAQQLMGALMFLQAHERTKAPEAEEVEATYQEALAAVRRASAEARRLMNRLKTPVLERFGLVDALQDLVRQVQQTAGAPEIELVCRVEFDRLAGILENSLYRIAQEALSNACRHSRTEKVCVKLTQARGVVTLEVRDWGVGFDSQAVHEDRFGLAGIRERVRLLGGKLVITTKPGHGTTIRAAIPLADGGTPDA